MDLVEGSLVISGLVCDLVRREFVALVCEVSRLLVRCIV
jgi:hypothetical protein